MPDHLDSIKLIITDLDNTLLHKINRIHRRNITVFKALVNNPSYHLSIISGRGLKRIIKVLKKMQCYEAPIFISGFNGAFIYDNGEQKMIKSQHLSAAQAKFIFKLVNQYKLEAWSYSAEIYNLAYLSQKKGFWIFKQNIEKKYKFRTFDVHNPQPISKIIVKIPHKLTDQFFSDLTVHHKYSIFKDRYKSDKSAIFEINPVGVDKAMAGKWLIQRLNLTPQQVMVIADGYNDLEIMKWAGTAIAVGNAAPEIKAIADNIVATSARGGFAEAIQPLLESK